MRNWQAGVLMLTCLGVGGAIAGEGELREHEDTEAPPISLEDLDGERHELSDYEGRVVMVNFWATWCPPCIEEMPAMQRVQDELGEEVFKILAVNMQEDPEEMRTFIEEKVETDFTILVDEDAEAVRAWSVRVLPTTYLVDGEGNIRYSLVGGAEWDEAEYMEVIEELVDELDEDD